MKYVALLMVVFAVAACEEKKIGGYTEKELKAIKVDRNFEELDKLAATMPPGYKKPVKPSSGVPESSAQK